MAKIKSTRNALKSDVQLAQEVREILDEYCAVANELVRRDLEVHFEISRGTDGKPARVLRLLINKHVMNYFEKPEEAK